MQSNSRVTFTTSYVSRWTGTSICCFALGRCLFVLAALLCVMSVSFADVQASPIVPFHILRGFAVVVPVSVNGSGPYDFMLDTGSTITAVDTELGRELGLETQEQGTVTTLVEHLPVSLAIACRVTVGPVTEQSVEVMVRDLSGIRRVSPTIRGVLGQNALNHADYLLDYRHKLLEFDMDGDVERSLAGNHVPLRREPVKGNPQFANLSVHASVVNDGVHATDFLLDSGAASLVLFENPGETSMESRQSVVGDAVGRQQMTELRNLQLLIDGKSREVPTNVVAFRGAEKEIGGLLPTGIFSRVYISNSAGFVMFEPKVKKPGRLDRMVAGVPAQGPHTGKS